MLVSKSNLFGPSRVANAFIRCWAQQSSLTNRSSDELKSFQMEAASDRQKFLKSFQQCCQAASNNVISDNTSQSLDFLDNYKKVLDYSIPHGDLVAGLTTIKAFKELKHPLILSEDEYSAACTLGWCMEMTRAYVEVVHDIMDGSRARSGKLSGHKWEGVGIQAVKDLILIQSGVYKLLRSSFGQVPYYARLFELINECYWETHLGQSMDMRFSTTFRTTRSMKPFTLENCFNMGRLKTCSLLYVPIALAMTVNGIDDPEAFVQAKYVCQKIGEYFVAQDDMMNVFGGIDESGQVGSDIVTGKCSWLTVTAVQLANKQQLKIIEENYGRNDSHYVQRVRDVFLELKLLEHYEKQEQNTYDLIVDIVARPSFRMPASIFLYCLHFICRGKEKYR